MRFLRQPAVVPAVVVFHEDTPLPLIVCAGPRDRGRTNVQLANDLFQRRLVVSIDFACFQSERAQLFGNVPQTQHLVGSSHRLVAVGIHNHQQVRQLELLGEQERFPNGAFVDFAVADDRLAALAGLQALGRQGQTYADREPMPERSGADFHARNMCLGKPLQTRAVVGLGG